VLLTVPDIVLVAKDMMHTFLLPKASGRLYIRQNTTSDLVDWKICIRLTPRNGVECMKSSRVSLNV